MAPFAPTRPRLAAARIVGLLIGWPSQSLDCHEPRALTLRLPGNAVRARCHTPARYDSPEHHRSTC